MKKSFKGFTLVEVLIVIIIVGILVAALLPRLVGAQARARDTARNAAVNQIATATALAVADGGATALGTLTTTAVDPCGIATITSNMGSCPVGPQGNTMGILLNTAGEVVIQTPALEITDSGNCDSAGDATASSTHFCAVVG